MNRSALEITPQLSFQVILNLPALIAVQRALAYTTDHLPMPPDDPIRALAEAFFQALKNVELNQSLLGSLMVKMDLSAIKAKPPEPPAPAAPQAIASTSEPTSENFEKDLTPPPPVIDTDAPWRTGNQDDPDQDESGSDTGEGIPK